MQARQMLRPSVALCGFVLLVAACTAPEVLDPRPANVPVNVDLSGHWLIREDLSADDRQLYEAIRRTDGVNDRDIFRRRSRTEADEMLRRSSDDRVKGGLVDVFLETGKSLQVTQTEYGLFISFDRAVVEEYRFGENRMVNVGEVQAQRVTGWEGGELVVETLDRNRMKLTERYRLVDGGKTLERTIVLRSKEGETETLVQKFGKAP